MKKRKVLCPGCGKPMECSEPHLYVYETPESMCYVCGYACWQRGCGWRAPNGSGKTKEEALLNAYDVAKRRV